MLAAYERAVCVMGQATAAVLQTSERLEASRATANAFSPLSLMENGLGH